jgi:hypothetical protein
MKFEQAQPQFMPLSITIENQEELDMMLDMCEFITTNIEDSKIRNLSIDIHNHMLNPNIFK